MSKPRLTPEEHADLGRVLAGIRDELTHRFVQLSNAYPMSGQEGVAARKLETARRAVDDARSALDDALCREHPDAFETTVYYPHPEDRAVVSTA